MVWTDITALEQLELVLFPGEPWSAATWWAELAERPRREYLIAEDTVTRDIVARDTVAKDTVARDTVAPDGAQLAGYAGLDHGGAVADIMTLAVGPAYQRCGLGDLLLTELLRRAAARGASSVMLEVRADNLAALRLYGRHGFERVSVRRGYYQPDGADAHVLRARVP